MEWISVKDKLPKQAESVLVYDVTVDASRAIQIWKWLPTDIEFVSHWMPLPEPPTEA